MTKICILTSVHPVFDARIFYKEAKALANAGYDITLIAQHHKDEVIDGIKIIALPKPKNRWERFLKTDFLLYKKALQEKADVYHFHDPELLPWTLRLKHKTGAKIIYDVHEDVTKQLLFKYWIPKFFRKVISRIFNFLEKFTSKNFDLIIAATPDIKNNFKQKNVIDIKNYPIIRVFEPLKGYAFPKNKNIYNLIYVGILTENRGVKEIIQSIKFINPKYNIKLNLAGKFSDEKFKNKIQNMEGWMDTQYLGHLPYQEVLKYINIADIGLVCIHPTKYFLTSLPVKMFEYMLGSLPVIASNFFLWKKIMEKNYCGICADPLDPKKIAKAIEYLIEHPNEAKKMGENGRKAVLEKYNWENESKKLLKVYTKLCKQ